ncbi:MAG: hypothetical protein H7222_09440, partial [Methylotenera sp.]|nr:hypothetical protein [Oligoflexia bacterium]
HYVGAMDPGHAFHTLLTYMGVIGTETSRLEDLFVPLDPDGFDVMHFPEFSFQFPKGYEKLITRLSAEFPGERGAIESYFEKVREVAVNFPTYQFRETLDMTFIVKALVTPLSTVVRELTSNVRLQAVFMSYCALHGVEPDDVGFGMHAIVTDSLIQSPYGLAEGGDAVARKYLQAIERNGGKVLMRKKVAQIETEGRMAKAVITTDGERHEAEWIISGIHPKRTLELVSEPSAFSPAFVGRLKNLRESTGFFGVYAACSTQPDLSSLKNYYYFSSSDPKVILSTGSPQEQPNAVFLCPASRIPGESKYPFSMNLHATGPLEWFSEWQNTKLGQRPEAYQKLKNDYAEGIFARVEQYSPGTCATVDRFATSTPLTNLHFNGTPDGSPYGMYHSIQNTGARAIGPRTHVANLLLTGQNSLFPGLLGAVISGLRTTGHIIGIKPLLRELMDLKVKA